MAAREPLSSAHLDSLGLLGALSGTYLHPNLYSLTLHEGLHSNVLEVAKLT